jgi:hypothetical protein
MLGGALGCGIGCCLLGAGAGGVGGRPADGCKIGLTLGGYVGLGAGVLASIFVSYFIATIICNKFSTLPSFTYTDSLKVLGHTIWMYTGLSIIGCCYIAHKMRNPKFQRNMAGLTGQFIGRM